MTRSPQEYRAVAEAAWRWVMEQVHWQDGPWVPVSVSVPKVTDPAWDRDGLHSGVGGLAHVLAEIRLSRPWTTDEQHLADAIADRISAVVPTQTDCTFFDGLVSSIGTLTALGSPGVDAAVARLAALAEPDGWPQSVLQQPAYSPGAHINDLTLGTAGVLVGALWARRQGAAGAAEIAQHAAAVLLAEAEDEPAGTNWPMVPARFCNDRGKPQCRTSLMASRASPRPLPWLAWSSTVPT